MVKILFVFIKNKKWFSIYCDLYSCKQWKSLTVWPQTLHLIFRLDVRTFLGMPFYAKTKLSFKNIIILWIVHYNENELNVQKQITNYPRASCYVSCQSVIVAIIDNYTTGFVVFLDFTIEFIKLSLLDFGDSTTIRIDGIINLKIGEKCNNIQIAYRYISRITHLNFLIKSASLFLHKNGSQSFTFIILLYISLL